MTIRVADTVVAEAADSDADGLVLSAQTAFRLYCAAKPVFPYVLRQEGLLADGSGEQQTELRLLFAHRRDLRDLPLLALARPSRCYDVGLLRSHLESETLDRTQRFTTLSGWYTAEALLRREQVDPHALVASHLTRVCPGGLTLGLHTDNAATRCYSEQGSKRTYVLYGERSGLLARQECIATGIYGSATDLANFVRGIEVVNDESDRPPFSSSVAGGGALGCQADLSTRGLAPGFTQIGHCGYLGGTIWFRDQRCSLVVAANFVRLCDGVEPHARFRRLKAVVESCITASEPASLPHSTYSTKAHKC